MSNKRHDASPWSRMLFLLFSSFSASLSLSPSLCLSLSLSSCLSLCLVTRVAIMRWNFGEIRIAKDERAVKLG